MPSESLPEGGPDGQTLPGALYQAGPGARTLWSRTLPGVVMTSPDLAVSPNGEVVIHLMSERLPRDPTGLVIDDWLVRVDRGRILWIERVEPSAKVAYDGAGNIVLAWPAGLQKLDGSGALLWSKSYAPRGAYETVSLAVDSDLDIIVARIVLDASPVAIDVDARGFLELEKMDPDGERIWVKRFGDSTTLLNGAFLALDDSNSIVLLASQVDGAVDFGGGALTGHNVLAKYDAAGQYQWGRVLGGYPEIGYQATSPVVVDPAGGILVRNEVIGPVDIGLGPIECFRQIALKFDSSGVPQWNACVLADNLAILPDGSLVAASTLRVQSTVGGQLYAPVDEFDGLLAHHDPSANWLDTECTLEPGIQVFGAVAADPSGSLVLVGTFGGQLTLPGDVTLAPATSNGWTSFVAGIAPWN